MPLLSTTLCIACAVHKLYSVLYYTYTLLHHSCPIIITQTHARLLNEAFALYSLANPLHADLWPRYTTTTAYTI